MYHFYTLQLCFMCTRNVNDETICFDKFTAFLTKPILDFAIWIMADSAYFVESTFLRVFSVFFK